MKILCVSVLLAGFFVIAGCQKSNDHRSRYPLVYLHDCISRTVGTDQVEICFDNLVSDSRCPIGAMCVWQGAAVAEFSFTAEHQSHNIRLATLEIPGTCSRDTLVAGYKIELVDIYPFPVLQHVTNPSEIRAEINISKQ